VGARTILEFRLDRHDRTQLELKLDYQLRKDVKNQNYDVETYIFVPRSLCLTKQNYPRERFYSDTAAFIRMTAPVLPLSELSKKTTVKPWASDIQAEIDNFADGMPGDIDAAEHNLKLLGCVFKRAVRDARLRVRADISKMLENPEQDLSSKLLKDFEDDVRTALRRLRKVGDKSGKEGVPEKLRVCWRAVDEYTALIAEEALTDLVALVEPLLNSPRLTKAADSLRDLAIEQYLHRRKSGYKSYADEGERNEYLPHRWRVLKRYISSALYLDVSREQSGRIATRVVAMIAAGAAMLFATLALLFIQEHWATSLSTAFIVAMVLSYIIKDQIKDIGKRSIGSKMAQFMPDHVVTIYGNNEEQLGSCKENFQVREVQDVPSDVQELRYVDLDSHEAIEGRPETVLCHEKNISLSSLALRGQFAGATGLTDIIRLNMHPMLPHMDDPTEAYRYIHPRNRTLMETQCARVYRVNVVLRLTADDGSSSLHRVRVVMNKKGIQRVEVVSQDPTHRMVETIEEIPLPVEINSD